MIQPLAHLRILDLSRILAGPWATQLLADLGAEVIKIERPGTGDETRSWGPPFIINPDPASHDPGMAAYFTCTNRGKHSLAIDFTHPQGAERVRELVANADVVVENFKVGGLAKYGLDYESLRAIKPDLVYCSITGFGQTGPYAQRSGYDFLIQGMGGLMSVTGQPEGTPGGEPMKVGVAVNDLFTGLYATVAILAALTQRDRTGQGQYIDLALLDVQVATLANQAANYLAGGQAPGRLGNAHPNICPYQAFQTADDYLILAVGNDGQFRRFCELAGHAALADDPQFSTNKARVENREQLVPQLQHWFRQQPRDWWLEHLAQVGVPCGPINTIDQVFADPQVIARGLRMDTHLADGTPVAMVGNPIRFAETSLTASAPPPLMNHDVGDMGSADDT